MRYSPVSSLSVSLNFGHETYPVGQLALQNRQIWFEYHPTYLDRKLPISPFKLPLSPGIKTCDTEGFEGLFGVFNDSLPDGWGRLLLDRYIKTLGIPQQQLTPMDRLSAVGSHGMGALCYKPEFFSSIVADHPLNLSQLEQETQLVLEGAPSHFFFENLLRLNGSSHGARPKIMAQVSLDKTALREGHSPGEEWEPWLIKFKATSDADDSGPIEYAYSLMAKLAGLTMPSTYLFENRYFGVKRFDIDENHRYHMHTLSGLLHAYYRIPNLDYADALKATQLLTKSTQAVAQHFRLAAFNVLAHNRDDHSKNTAYLMDRTGCWTLAPAYDLTFSFGPGGEQSMTVMGEGKNPNKAHLLKLAQAFDIAHPHKILDEVQSAIEQWPSLAAQAQVTPTSTKLISKTLRL